MLQGRIFPRPIQQLDARAAGHHHVRHAQHNVLSVRLEQKDALDVRAYSEVEVSGQLPDDVLG